MILSPRLKARASRRNQVKFFVTGAAGFIASNLVDRLLLEGHIVVAYDNYSTGLKAFTVLAETNSRYTFIRGDVLDTVSLEKAMPEDVDVVCHLAANADVRFGTEAPRRDLEQNTIATFNVLEAMRKKGIKRIVFSSTGSVYGEAKIIPTKEEGPFPIQTSLYGASKLAGEGLISAYCEGFGFTGYIFRFVSILGERYTHGHVFDFYHQLRQDPKHLKVLGNGKQRKSYLYIQDCIDAILLVLNKATEKVNIFNLGTDEYCEVNHSIGWICEALKVSPKLTYTGGDRGWIGDNPFIFLDCEKIRSLNWTPKCSIKEGVLKTITFLQDNEWVFGERG